jgi:hypothetical protein
MLKSKLYFVDIDHTGLTGGTHRSDRSDHVSNNLVLLRLCWLTSAWDLAVELHAVMRVQVSCACVRAFKLS